METLCYLTGHEVLLLALRIAGGGAQALGTYRHYLRLLNTIIVSVNNYTEAT